jgi:hypothetical protein
VLRHAFGSSLPSLPGKPGSEWSRTSLATALLVNVTVGQSGVSAKLWTGRTSVSACIPVAARITAHMATGLKMEQAE